MPDLNRFRILSVLGEGAVGRVLSAEDSTTGEVVAIKVLKAGLDEVVSKRFVREADLLKKYPHPCLVPVLEANLGHHPPYMVFPMMQGGDLTSKLREGRGLPAQEVMGLGLRIGRALAHLHVHGVLHRDVKPANILLDSSGDAHLGDLGIGMEMGAGRQEQLTATGYIVGTLKYLAPELLQRQRASPASDIFGLAVTLIELRTGIRAHSDPTQPRFSTELLSGLSPPAFGTLMRTCLRSDPTRRPLAGGPFVSELEAAMATVAGDPEGRPPEGYSDATRTVTEELSDVGLALEPSHSRSEVSTGTADEPRLVTRTAVSASDPQTGGWFLAALFGGLVLGLGLGTLAAGARFRVFQGTAPSAIQVAEVTGKIMASGQPLELFVGAQRYTVDLRRLRAVRLARHRGSRDDAWIREIAVPSGSEKALGVRAYADSAGVALAISEGERLMLLACYDPNGKLGWVTAPGGGDAVQQLVGLSGLAVQIKTEDRIVLRHRTNGRTMSRGP